MLLKFFPKRRKKKKNHATSEVLQKGWPWWRHFFLFVCLFVFLFSFPFLD